MTVWLLLLYFSYNLYEYLLKTRYLRIYFHEFSVRPTALKDPPSILNSNCRLCFEGWPWHRTQLVEYLNRINEYIRRRFENSVQKWKVFSLSEYKQEASSGANMWLWRWIVIPWSSTIPLKLCAVSSSINQNLHRN